MKLARLGEPGRECPVIVFGHGGVLNASSVTSDFTPEWLASGGLQELQRAVDKGALNELQVAEDARFGPPITRPGKLVCIGLNYAEHAADSGAEVPSEPTVFFKAPNTVVGPNDDVLLPIAGDKTDWEVELAVVIGATCRYLPNEKAAAAAIAGFAISNDVSERSFQLERGGQWVKGKSCETFNPLGPWIVTPDEVGDPQKLEMRLSVNGVQKQRGSTSDMLFGVNHIVHYLSQFMVLEPGDLINTGTPAGVGLGFSPPQFLREGDQVELTIEKLGTQQQRCVQASP